VARELLRLVIRAVRAADLGALVPVQAQPAEPVEDRLQGLRHVALLVGVVDAEDELAVLLPGEQPVEQGRADPADVQVAGRARGEAGANRHGSAIPWQRGSEATPLRTDGFARRPGSARTPRL